MTVRHLSSDSEPSRRSRLIVILSSAIMLLAFLFGYLSYTRFETANRAWEAHSIESTAIEQALSRLQSRIGYGGFIHNFKNLVLRRDLGRYQTRIDADILGLNEQIDRLAGLLHLAEERAALDQLRSVFAQYIKNYQQVLPLLQQGATTAQLDASVKVDDGPALMAFGYLRERTQERAQATQQQARALHVSAVRFALIGGTLMALLMVFGIFLISAVLHRLSLSTATERRSQKLLADVLDAASELSIIATDAQGLIRVFNRGAERLVGYSAEEMVDQQSPAILHLPEEVSARGQALSEQLGRPVEGFRVFIEMPERHGSEKREWTYVHRDGHTIPVTLVVTTMRGDGGKITGYLGVAEDITERKRLERMKTEFVSTVSHELRTPLTSITGSLGLLAGGAMGALPEPVQGLLTIALSNSQRLSHLIDDLLDMEKIAVGKMDFAMQRQALMPLVEASLQENAGYAESHQVRFSLTDRVDDLEIEVDEQRFKQVLANLLSNAAKFSPEKGSVEVRVQRRDERVRVSVVDQGPGIPEEFHGRIFEKFAQADASDTRQKGGTGLGLAITKELVQKMGGSIGFQSQEGGGANFWVEWPVAVLDGIAEEGQ